jgi:predicted nicotinamide N-methyase
MKNTIQYKTHQISWDYKNHQINLEVIDDLDQAIDDICDFMEGQNLTPDPFREDLCPYFGVLWPSAQAMGQFLIDYPDTFHLWGPSLELGAGLSLPSLVLSKYFSSHFSHHALDFHPDVELFLKKNQELNQVKVNFIRHNWCQEDNGPLNSLGPFSVILASDILYESKHPKEIAAILNHLAAAKTQIVLSDPGRAYLSQFLLAMKNFNFKYSEFTYPIEDNRDPVKLYLFSRI